MGMGVVSYDITVIPSHLHYAESLYDFYTASSVGAFRTADDGTYRNLEVDYVIFADDVESFCINVYASYDGVTRDVRLITNRFYPPDLAHVEARNASPDRSHNETFDSLAITGLLGFLLSSNSRTRRM